MEGLEGRTEGKGIARGIVVVEIEEDSFRGKLSYKRIGERVLVARAGIMGAMCSKDTIREEGIEGERDVIMGEERIEDIEGTESDTKIVTELGGRDGEIETIIESTKIGEERDDDEGG